MSFDFVSVILSVFVYGEITDFNLINFINISWLDNTKMTDKIATRVAKDVNKYLKKSKNSHCGCLLSETAVYLADRKSEVCAYKALEAVHQ